MKPEDLRKLSFANQSKAQQNNSGETKIEIMIESHNKKMKSRSVSISPQNEIERNKIKSLMETNQILKRELKSLEERNLQLEAEKVANLGQFRDEKEGLRGKIWEYEKKIQFLYNLVFNLLHQGELQFSYLGYMLDKMREAIILLR